MSIKVSAAVSPLHGAVQPSIKSNATALATRVWTAVSEFFRNCWRFITSFSSSLPAKNIVKLESPKVPPVLLADWAEPKFGLSCNVLKPVRSWVPFLSYNVSAKMAVVVKEGDRVVQCYLSSVASLEDGRAQLRVAFSQKVNPDEVSMLALVLDDKGNVYHQEQKASFVGRVSEFKAASNEAVSNFVVKTCNAFNNTITEKVRQYFVL